MGEVRRGAGGTGAAGGDAGICRSVRLSFLLDSASAQPSAAMRPPATAIAGVVLMMIMVTAQAPMVIVLVF